MKSVQVSQQTSALAVTAGSALAALHEILFGCVVAESKLGPQGHQCGQTAAIHKKSCRVPVSSKTQPAG